MKSLVENLLAAIAAACLAVTLVGAGLEVCLLQPTTRLLSEHTSAVELSPYTAEELTNLAVATRDFTVAPYGDTGWEAAAQTLAEKLVEAGQTSAQAPEKADFWENLPISVNPLTSRLAPLAIAEGLADFSESYALNADALSHLRDCNALINSFIPALAFCALFALFTLGVLHIVNKRNPRAAFIAARICTGAPIVILAAFAALGVWALFDFNGLFAAFHSVLFPQGNWTFAYDSLLICMYPLDFWVGMAIIWFAVTAVASIICLLFAWALRRTARQRIQAAKKKLEEQSMTQETPARPRVRFAPSPTGRLHIGGARTAIYNWAFARATGGTFVLRIEDTDPERSTQENVDVILNAMKWMRLSWDEGPEVGGEFGPYYQMQRMNTYTAALEELKAKGAAYPCFCTKEELDAKREKAQAEEGGYAGYDGTCRKLSAEEAQARIAAGEPHVWRLAVPENRGAIEFDDAVYGHMSFPADALDDMILVRSDGSPTYNFACVCDDANMQITHVIRGDDHLSNTPKQILIYEALGKPVPTFAHLSMILGADGKKLSKRHGATSVEEYRDRGYLSDALVNFLALLGWSLDGETTIISRDVLCEKFSLNRITKKDAIFDETKLDWMNGVYIREMGAAKWVELSKPYLLEAGADEGDLAINPEYYEKMYPLVAERLTHLPEVAEKLAFLFWGSTVQLDETSVKKVLAKEGARADEALRACREILADESRPWEAMGLQDACKALCEPMELKPKLLFQPLRVAVSGNMVSPPLFESIELMEREDVLARIDYTLATVFGE